MKKMQCEVCGSTEIRKISDDIFQCQSCGIEYSKSEVQKLLVEITGEVKIDHSKEIENMLARAMQFLDEGDNSRALEYYNKVLDLDPNNEDALNAIQEVNEKLGIEKKKIQEETQRRSSTVKVLKHTVNPSDGVANFLRAFKNAPDITPDVYKKIEIMSVTQGYYPFSVVDKQYSGSYDAVACYRKQVPYTDYETKTDYSNKNQDGSYKKVQVAVTKYREEIDRQKVDGSFSVDHFGVFSVSQKLNGLFTSISPDKYDSELSKDEYFDEVFDTDLQQSLYNDVVLRRIEEQITADYNIIESSLTEVQTFKEKAINELEIFSGTSDANWENRITDLFTSEVRSKAGDKVKSILPGDFSEDVHYRWSERYGNTQMIYLPIQIIEYAYRGKFYLSAMILNKGNQMVCSYPCFTEIKKIQNATDKTITTTKKKAFPGGINLLYLFAGASILSPLWIAITEGDIPFDFASVIIGIGIMLFLIPAVIWHIIWKSKKNAAVKNAILENAAALDSVKNSYNLELTKGSQAFFKVFTDLASLENAVAAAKEVSSYNVDISSIKSVNAFISVEGGKSVDVKNASSLISGNILDINGEKLIDGCQYTVRLINSGSEKIAVIKIIREVCGFGLVTAKEIADSSQSVVAQGLTSTIADNLATQLKSAGAAVEIDKEI